MEWKRIYTKNLTDAEISFFPYHARSLFMLTIPIGYTVTASHFTDRVLEYLLYNILSFFGFLVCLVFPFSIELLPVWVLMLVFFVAYYIQFYLLVLDPSIFAFIHPVIPLCASSEQALLNVFRLTTIAFLGFVLSSLLFILARSKHNPNVNKERRGRQLYPWPTRSGANISLLLAIAMALITGLVVYKYNLIMGMVKKTLPFKLEGLIVYTRTVMVPMMLFLPLLRKLYLRKKIGVYVMLIIIYAVSDMFLRGSKGTLLFSILVFIFLLPVLDKDLYRKYIRSLTFWIIVSVLSSIILFPIIASLRAYWISQGVRSWSSLELKLRGRLFWQGISYMVARITGANALLPIVKIGRSDESVFTIITWPRGVSGYVTQVIYGIKQIHFVGIAPSLVGFFYLLFGSLGAFLGVSMYIIGALIGWRTLGRLRLRSLPIARAFFLLWFFQASHSGVLDRAIYYSLPIFVISLGLCEFLSRLVLKSSKKPHRIRVQKGVVYEDTVFGF